jgi:hypothetical protein
MKLNITKNDIRYGQQHNPSNCAIAQSIQRKLRKQKRDYADINVLPDHVSIQVFEEGKLVTYGTPMPFKGSNFVHRFDNDLRVKPFSLNLNLQKIRQVVLAK